MCSFATKFVVASWSTCAEPDMTELDTTFSVVVTLVEKLALGATNEPLMSMDNCADADTMFAPSPTIAVVKLLLELEPDITPAPNPTIAAADKEPLTSADTWADDDTIFAPSLTIAVVKLLLELEPDMIPAPNPTTAAADNEPLMSSEI